MIRLALACIAVLLCGCSAAVKNYGGDGKTLTSSVSVPLGFDYDTRTGELLTSKHFVDRTADVMIGAPESMAKVAVIFKDKQPPPQ